MKYKLYDGVKQVDLETYQIDSAVFPWGCSVEQDGSKTFNRVKYTEEHFAISNAIQYTADLSAAMIVFCKNGGKKYTITFDVKGWQGITITIRCRGKVLLNVIEVIKDKNQSEGLIKAISWILDKENQDG